MARELRTGHSGPWVPIRTRRVSWERFANTPETPGAAAAGLTNATNAIAPATVRTAVGIATTTTIAGAGVAETDTAHEGDARGMRGGMIANVRGTETEAATATASVTATMTAMETTRCVTDRAPHRLLEGLLMSRQRRR